MDWRLKAQDLQRRMGGVPGMQIPQAAPGPYTPSQIPGQFGAGSMGVGPQALSPGFNGPGAMAGGAGMGAVPMQSQAINSTVSGLQDMTPNTGGIGPALGMMQMGMNQGDDGGQAMQQLQDRNMEAQQRMQQLAAMMRQRMR